MWRPINEDHSIEMMSIVIGFHDALSSLVYRKIIRRLEEATNANGLNIQQPIQGMEFRLDSAGVTPQPINITGMSYQKNSLIRLQNNNVVNKIVEQLQFQPQAIQYLTWKYTRWAPAVESIQRLIYPALEIAAQAVSLSSVRIEYFDRFILDGDGVRSSPSDVLCEESPLIAKDIFSSDDLWHSHTGKLVNIDAQRKRLFQVNIDAQELASPEELVGARSISIMNSVEDRFLNTGWELTDIHDQVGTELNELHKESKELYSKILNPNMAAKVGLE
ncbi:hypothetical protein P8H26_14850 [Pseudochrobactrum sp. sp1633]|uniref:hypothetical protein n=1 Tax=Pseudochrobactrum sp. sp1633 TaxID=3036706 RepID=UPI0025A4D404|nr:hypothetical protein [Pseudochrobactrum sp. sp1633]MDM8346669.1 hypothetical protein [Pseudochrobactrum sp. sp1633]